MGAFASPYLCDDEAVSTNDSLALACVKEKAVHENRNGFEFATALRAGEEQRIHLAR